jgi:Kdo2-lipid IVA lauroyltransferase/acyltransferase
VSESRLRSRLEALAAGALFALFGALPLGAASALGGWIGRCAGRLLPSLSRRAMRNLRRALPELDEAAASAVLRGMWDNLGRTAAEFPHLHRMREAPEGNLEIAGRENLAALRDGGMVFSGHLGNWEAMTPALALLGAPVHGVYRAANNPLTDALINRQRLRYLASLAPKGREGAKRLLALAKQRARIGMLVDQKLNEGIALPFFGRPAMTAPALAQLALRFDLPVAPVRCERLAGPRLRLTLYPPLALRRTGDREADVRALMSEANAILEGWIRERPEQWLWLHRRWKD